MHTMPSTNFPDRLEAADLELRRLRAPSVGAATADVDAIDSLAATEDIPAIFYYFTSIPAGDGRLREFLAEDVPRVTYGVWSGTRPLGSTSLYDWDLSARTCMIGYTWLAPAARGTGANSKVKAALFEVLRNHGFTGVRLRADIANERSRAAMRKVGAREAEIEPGPRLYPWDGGRRSRSQYFELDL